MILRICRAARLLLILIGCLCLTVPSVAADSPPWPANSVIYCAYPSIFSPTRDFAGVTARMKRLKQLGVTVLWLMPVTPMGHAINGHPDFDSPYCVHDYYALNPDYGSSDDFRALVTTAHQSGIKVILDEVLNHSAWDNALITQHPEFYVHNDGDPKNAASITQAFNYSDVAQFNYADPGLRSYMIRMLRFWITRYNVDGFRFDTADDPDGPNRMIPADFWQDLSKQLHAVDPNVLLLGECETPDLAMKPFPLDYGWWLYPALKDASNGGDARAVVTAWRHQTGQFPPGMKHMSLQDDWDDSRDVRAFGSPAGAMAAAAFNFTDTGIPLIYNGMEIGNAAGENNPHAVIDWQAGDPNFPKFYQRLIALRRANPALSGGTMTWLSNSVPAQVLTYVRTGHGHEFLIEINLSSTAAQGTVTVPDGQDWKEVTVVEQPGAARHASPPQVSLQPKAFAFFERSTSKQ